jgi:DNA-binding transcriptional LysR family regulator
MQRGNLNDLLAFLAVGQERSFTKAAAKLGVSQSALSHTIRGLEERLGLRLLTRTTRSVAPTEVGERLLHTIGPRFEEIEAELTAVSEFREKPAGTIRITATEYAADAILLPEMAKLLPLYPDIKVEIIIDYGLTDIVSERFDAGVRSGEQVAKDMIAVRIGPDMRMAVVGAPSYFKTRPEPQQPHDLVNHNCIALRLPHGGLYAWEFEKDGRELRVRVDGQLTYNTTAQMLNARLPDWAWPTCLKAGHNLIWRRVTSSGSSNTGASRIRATTCIIRAAANAGLRLAGRCTSLPRMKAPNPAIGL